MSNCAFGLPTDNRALTGTLSASAQIQPLDVSQLANDQGATSRSWQTPVGTTAGWVQLDAGAAVAWDAVGLFNANLTPAATVRVRFSGDPSFGTSIADSGVVAGLVAPGYRQAIHLPASTVTARYVRVDIADPTNPESCLRAAQLFAGTLRRPARNLGYDSRVQRAAERGEVRTRGGQSFFDLRHARRAWAISLPSLAAAEVWPLVMEIQRATEAGGNLLFLPFPAGADVARDAVFGPLRDAAPVTFPSPTPRLRAWSATIEERL
jgi:hypothetical protein